MPLEDAVRLLMPAGELGDEVHAEVLACAKKGLIRIEEDGTLVLTEDGKRRAEQLEENVKTATAEDAIKPESQPTRMTTVEFDLHGYYPGDIYNGLLSRIVQQAWEMGASELDLIHGHGRNRGIVPYFVNTNTGLLGLAVRRTLKSSLELRQRIYHSTINRGDAGLTSIRLKPNPAPSRTEFEL